MKNKIKKILFALILISLFTLSTSVMGFRRPSIGSRINGTITDGYTGDGIGDVKITLIFDGYVEDVKYSSNDPSTLGDYEVVFIGLIVNPTPCILRVEKTGYMTREVIATLPGFGDPPITKDIEMDILPVTIQGYLTDLEGNIITGGPIILRRESDDQIIRNTASDLSGYYIMAFDWFETTQVYFTGVDNDEETYDIQIEEEIFTIHPATTYTKNLETSTLYKSEPSGGGGSYPCNWATVIPGYFPVNFVINCFNYISADGYYLDVETKQWVDEFGDQPRRPTDIRIQTAFVIEHELDRNIAGHWSVSLVRTKLRIMKLHYSHVDPIMNIYKYGDHLRTNAIETSSNIGLISSLARDISSILLMFLPDWLEPLALPFVLFSMAGKIIEGIDRLSYTTYEEDRFHQDGSSGPDGIAETEVSELIHVPSIFGPLYPHDFSENRGHLSVQFWNKFNLHLDSDPEGPYMIFLLHEVMFSNSPDNYIIPILQAIPFHWLTR